MNCQPSSEAQLNTIQHQQPGNCVENKPELKDSVEQSSSLAPHWEEEIHDENDLVLHEGFLTDPTTDTSNKPVLALRAGPGEDNKQTEDEDCLSCEYCEKQFDNKLSVLECYTRHFKHELENVCKSFLDSEQHNQQCPFCSEKFEHFDSLTCHLGTVHLLVNDFLIQEGVRPLLPSNEDYETYLDSLEI